MITSPAHIGVFVSSSLSEPKKERRIVQRALDIFDRCLKAWLWEDHAVAGESTIQQACMDEVDRCQIYPGLFWLRYGNYTIEEFDRATSGSKPRLIFVTAHLI